MDDIWREDETTPGAIEAALRKMFAQRHKEERAYVPARVMNMVVIVDKDFRGEIDMFGNKASRGSLLVNLVVCGYAAYRTQLFCYLKSCGRDELNTMNLWAGRDGSM